MTNMRAGVGRSAVQPHRARKNSRPAHVRAVHTVFNLSNTRDKRFDVNHQLYFVIKKYTLSYNTHK